MKSSYYLPVSFYLLHQHPPQSERDQKKQSSKMNSDELRPFPFIHLPAGEKTPAKGSAEWTKLCLKVRAALEEHAAVILRHDGIVSGELFDRAFAAMRVLFDLPAAAKRRISVAGVSSFDYMWPNPLLPLYESFDVAGVDSPESLHAFAELLCPDGNDEALRGNLETMSKKMVEMGQLIMTMIFESYGVEVVGSGDWTHNLFRMSKYTAAPLAGEGGSTKKTVALPAHSGNSFISLLFQNEVDGLQLKTRDGGEWVQVNLASAPRCSFVVFAGNALQAWSNGRIPSPFHRVEMMSRGGKEERFSCGLFLKPATDQTIVAPPELVDGEHPARYKPFAFGDLLEFAGEHLGEEKVLDMFAAI